MDVVLTPSEWNREVFERHGIRNAVVAPLGIDDQFFTPQPVSFLTVLSGYGYRGSRAKMSRLHVVYERARG
jgi:hypothetical protein